MKKLIHIKETELTYVLGFSFVTERKDMAPCPFNMSTLFFEHSLTF